MLIVVQEGARHPEIIQLLEYSDAYSAARYPEEDRHPVDVAFLARPHVRFFVARNDGAAVGCGAAVIGTNDTAELKRMIVRPGSRGQGIGRALLNTIQMAVRAEGIRTLRLETGPRNLEALDLYRRGGYRERGSFGDYRPTLYSVFMEKELP